MDFNITRRPTADTVQKACDEAESQGFSMIRIFADGKWEDIKAEMLAKLSNNTDLGACRMYAEVENCLQHEFVPEICC